jgi:hypothetical protein
MLRSSSYPLMRRLLRVLWRSALTCALTALAVAHASAGATGPRLRLPEDGAVVSPGEVVTFYWDGADRSIREMEILLSTDGGSHYAECVSPQLDPKAGKFTWRVPNLGVGRMHFRIRFNRDGREIEAESSASLHIIEPPHEPIALPPSSEVTEAEAAAPGTAGSETGDSSSSGREGPASGGEGRSLDRGLGKDSRTPPGHSAGSTVSGRPSPGSNPDGGPPLLFIPPRK